MRAAAIPLAFLALALAACDSAPVVTFADASITLPDDPIELPAGPEPGRTAVLENCTACHSPSTMLQQPKVSREKWEGIARKMIEVYKAPVDPQAIGPIADYMVHVQASQPPR
ncbi:sulfite:cytochrome C oxidoreductase subunit b precursor [Porphyrobacter sp. TH134]|uniref:cytochrome c n=1 Tax=Porphyrobacter sp. TH134 TaxID=2067450 RepID=UPI000CC03C06|nr:cytochrome c [Porphyrobacter sp. TH134]PLK22958.1 sulfite:cytochrome C oxidoreductase subunit b precursor [Porphyrobacter sp. TH134]